VYSTVNSGLTITNPTVEAARVPDRPEEWRQHVIAVTPEDVTVALSQVAIILSTYFPTA